MSPPISIDARHTMVVEAFTPDDAARLGERLTRELDGDTDAMLHAAWLMGANAVRMALQFRRTCRICGCWELEACEGGCAWVADNLCSACDFAPDARQSPLPEPPQRPAHTFTASADRFAVTALVARVPRYWRVAAGGVIAGALFQGGFQLLNLPSTAAGMAGIACLLASGFTALSAFRTLLKDSQ